jgi:protein-S-isoprenylcysteine O-methyltransferase Ste14
VDDEQKPLPMAATSPDSVMAIPAAGSALILVCTAGAVACLWQWGEPVGRARMDRFSCGSLIFYGLFVLQHVRLYRGLSPSGCAFKEALGATYDPLMGLFIALLLLGQLTVFADYGHWHLTPWLERAGVQYAGLCLYLPSLFLVAWSDRCLIRGFAGGPAPQRVITVGPYRYLRHPRYAGLFMTTIAFALTFASILAWLLVPAWLIVVRRRIRIEERYLRDRFGAEYDGYARRTNLLFTRSISRS